MNSLKFQDRLLGLQDNLLNFAYMLTANREEAKDLLQDTTLKALDNEDKYIDNVNFKGWVFTIMRNIFINNYRRVVRNQTIIDQTEDLYHLNLPQDSGFASPEGSMQEDVRTILEKFDLLNDGKLNNASVVLFGRNFYHYPQCLLRLARFKGTTKDEFLDNQRVTGNIFNLLDAAMAFFFKHLSLSGKIEGLYREEELNVPYKALRECCINAFAHRVYHRPGSSVGIAIYDDRVEIENSGTFPPDITIEKLLGGHNSEPQNLIVANVLYKSAVLESWGRGIALMVNECRRVGIPDPEFHTDGNAVWIVFHYTRTTVGQDPTATPQQPYSNPTVTPQLGKLLSAIGNNTLSAKEIMEKTGMKDKRNFLKNYIHPAINSGLVLSLYPIGSKSPQQKYYLTDKGKGFLQQ